MITKAEMTTERIMSFFVSVKIKVEPKSVLQTSPERFVDGEKIFIRKYPTASEPTEIIATLASPFILELSFAHKIKIAQIIVMGRTNTVAFVIFKTEAIAIAPKAVCESPSPMYENRFKTRVTPKSEDESEIIIPATNAYTTKEKEKYVFIVSKIPAKSI